MGSFTRTKRMLVLVLFVLLPLSVNAETISSSTYSSMSADAKQQLIAVLEQLLQTLLAQIAAIESQQAAQALVIQNQQTQIQQGQQMQQQLTQIVTNTAPTPPPPPPAIVAPVILGPISLVRDAFADGSLADHFDLKFTTDRASAATVYTGGVLAGTCSYAAAGNNLPTSVDHEFKWDQGSNLMCVKVVVSADGLSTTYEHNVSTPDSW